MTKEQLKEEMEKRFDKIYKKEQEYSNWDMKDIKLFIQSEIDLAVAEREKEILDIVEKVKSTELDSNGRYNACTELYYLIKLKIKPHSKE